MSVRDYILLSATDKGLLKTAIVDVAQIWTKKWFHGKHFEISLSVLPVTAGLRAKINYHSPLIFVEQDNEWCAVALPRKMKGRFVSAMILDSDINLLGTSALHDKDILFKVILKALTDLCNELSMADLVSSDTGQISKISSIPKYASENGSGVHAIVMTIDELEVVIVLTNAQVRRLIRKADNTVTSKQKNTLPELIPFASVLASRYVQGEVSLGAVELTIGTLKSLNVGDVVQLDKSVNEPSKLRFPGTSITCKGFLGQCSGRRALSLIN
jgi:flagellar motor switch/type III secretory pathway protein FliN